MSSVLSYQTLQLELLRVFKVLPKDTFRLAPTENNVKPFEFVQDCGEVESGPKKCWWMKCLWRKQEVIAYIYWRVLSAKLLGERHPCGKK